MLDRQETCQGHNDGLLKFQQQLDNKLQDGLSSEDGIAKWSSFKGIVSETAKQILGAKTRVHGVCFDQNDEQIKEALKAKNQANTEWQNDPSSVSKCKTFKTHRIYA